MSQNALPFYAGLASRWFFLRTVLKNKTRRNTTKKPEVFLRIRELDDRYIYLLAEFFVQAGYFVNIIDSIKKTDYYNSDPYRFYVFMSKDIKYLDKVPGSPVPQAVLCSDHAVDGQVASRFDLTISLNYDVDIPPNTTHRALLLPYPMHPNVYHTGQLDRIPELRQRPKSVGVFFAGNLKGEYARASRLLRGYLSRPAAIASVLRHFGDRVRLFTTRAALLRALGEEDLTASIVVFDATTERLGREEWFPVLAKSRFFLALPGVVMPMCHNSVEAMALGVVPILGYGQLFSPRLESGAVCLGYVSETELAGAIKEALGMDAPRYERLRQRSMEHFDRYMVPGAFLHRFSHARGQRVEIRFPAEGVSEKLARAAHRQNY